MPRNKDDVLGGWPFADKLPDDRVKAVTDTIVKLQDFVTSMNKLQLRNAEFAYLKALVLFSPGW